MPSCYLGWSELVSGSAFGILLNPRVVSFSCSSSLLRRRCIRPAHFASKLAISEPNSVDCLLCSWFLSYFVFWICSIPHTSPAAGPPPPRQDLAPRRHPLSPPPPIRDPRRCSFPPPIMLVCVVDPYSCARSEGKDR